MLRFLLSLSNIKISISISVFASYRRKLCPGIFRRLFRWIYWILLRMSRVELHYWAGRIIWWFSSWQENRLRILSKLWEWSKSGLKTEESVRTWWDTWEVSPGLFWSPRYVRYFPIINLWSCCSSFSISMRFGTGRFLWDSLLCLPIRLRRRIRLLSCQWLLLLLSITRLRGSIR